jgi:hypothetical protein
MSDHHDLKNVLLSLVSLGSRSAPASDHYRNLCDMIDEVSHIDGNPRSMVKSAQFWAIFLLGSNIAPILRQWSLVAFACGKLHEAADSRNDADGMYAIAGAIKVAAIVAEESGL